MTSPQITKGNQVSLLFVDDEPNVLKALRRLFHNERYTIYLATGGTEGLEILRSHSVDLIISDMRMPEMNGVEFLSQVLERWPDTVRILLTGYADLQSTIDAVNKCRIFSYCTKPWNDQELQLLVQNALTQKFLLEDRDRLTTVIQQQNAELKTLNEHLEDRVQQRTIELENTLAQLLLRNQAIEATRNAITITDALQPGNPLVYANPAFQHMTGYTVTEALGQNLSFLHGEDHDQPGLETLRLAIRQLKIGQAIVRNYRKDGSLFWNEIAIAPVKNTTGEVTHYVGVMDDISAVKAYQEQLEYQATYDELTGLLNRNLLNDRFEQAISRAQRNQTQVCIVFLDIDSFKVINDTMGHSTGDELLKIIAKRLLNCARSSDTIARYGGDEFVLIFPEIIKIEEAAAIAERIITEISQPLLLNGHTLQETASIGISFYPDDGLNKEVLLQHADAAMYEAKESGRNTFRFYTEALNQRLQLRLKMKEELHLALKCEQLVVYYQPKIDVQSGCISGAEALLRWRHPEKGMIPPDQFIPLAEETGLILPIGEWVLKTACSQIKTWHDAGLPKITIAVNVSPKQLHNSAIDKIVAEVLLQTGLDAHYLDLEITEGAVMQDPEKMVLTLNLLKEIGVRISMDDFGTGYSSLSYLKRFPFDNLKIDKAFINEIPMDEGDMTLVLTIITMAHNFKLKVIAEGVENREQADFLKLQNCDEIQGYYFSRPLPAQEIQLLLENMKTTM